MKKQRTKWWMLVVALAVMVCSTAGCSATGPVVWESEVLNGAAVMDVPADIDSMAYVDAEDSRVLEQMSLQLQNDHMELYLGAYYDIAIRDKDTGAIFFSNRALYDPDVRTSLNDLGESQALSQLELEYYDSANHSFAMYSYPDAMDDKGKKGVTSAVQGDTLCVTYEFGEKNLNDIVCVAYAPEAFEALKEKGNQMVQDGELNRISWARFCDAYMQMTITELTGLKKTTYLERYPGLAELGAIYVLKDNQTDVTQRVVLEVSRQCGINAAYIRGQMKLTGAKQNVVGEAAYFSVSVRYRLDGRDLIAEVDPTKIESAAGYYLTKIYLLGSFGAVDPNSDGYLFVPDNSGAIIENAIKTTSLFRMDMPFYGTDFGLDISDGAQVAANGVFPVFGMKENTRTVFGIAESGEANGGIAVNLEDGIYPYHTIRPWVNYYVQDTTSYGSMLDEEKTRIFARKPNEDVFRMRYHFLYADEADYAGMAGYYRQYLLQSGRMLPREELETLPLQIDFIGAITKKQKVLGIPKEIPVSVSTIEDIDQITQQLAASLENASVHYVLQGAINGGMDFSIPTKLRFEKSVGSREAYLALAESVAQTGGDMALAIDFTRVYKDGNGLRKDQQLSHFISKEYACHANFLSATGLRNYNRQGYWIAPTTYATLIDSLLKSGDCEDIHAYLLSAASYLSGNYNENDFTTREASKRLLQQAAEKLQSNGVAITTEGANVYMLPYTDRVTDVPFDGGDHQLESYSIPFVGMVLHGSVSICGPALNLQSSYKTAYLKCIESGCGLHYRLITGDQLLLSQTWFSDMFSASAADWIDTICTDYQRAEQALLGTENSPIIHHERLAEGVFCTQFENGTRIVVNYNAEPQTVNGLTVAGLDFVVQKEGGVVDR